MPASKIQALGAWRDKPVIIGMRPEHFTLGDAEMESSFEVNVEVIEQLGSEIVLETCVGSAQLSVARVDPQAGLSTGDKIRLSVQAERLHFFDPVTEMAIR